MPKLKMRPNPNVRHIKIVFRVNATEMHEILKKAGTYIPGADNRRKMSKWCRHAAIHHAPKKSELE